MSSEQEWVSEAKIFSQTEWGWLMDAPVGGDLGDIRELALRSPQPLLEGSPQDA